jgi:hypothetical protein
MGIPSKVSPVKYAIVLFLFKAMFATKVGTLK